MLGGSGFFDSDRDVAALVYQPGEDPDAVLLAFTRALTARGVAVAGLLQRRRGTVVEFALVPGPFRPIACGTLLPLAAAALADAIEDGPKLLVINRYGTAELSGGGLLRVLAEGVRRDIPVLAAVPAALFPAWLAFTAGLAIRLPCNRAALDRWWRSLSPGAVPPPSPSPCERVK